MLCDLVVVAMHAVNSLSVLPRHIFCLNWLNRCGWWRHKANHQNDNASLTVPDYNHIPIHKFIMIYRKLGCLLVTD